MRSVVSRTRSRNSWRERDVEALVGVLEHAEGRALAVLSSTRMQ